MNIAAVNDAPTAANATLNGTEDTDYVFAATDFGFSDVDGDTMASVKITTLQSAGTLKLSGTDVVLNDVITKASIDAGNLKFKSALNGNGATYATIGFKVDDGT